MRAVLSLFAIAVALVAGVQAFIAVFFAPAVLYGDDQVLLVWGWIAPFAGLPVALLIGWLVRKVLHTALCRTLKSDSRRWAKATAVALTALACVALVGQFMLTFGDLNLKWSEEVRLSDGNSVVISRGAKGNILGRPRSQPEAWLPSEFIVDVAAVPGLSGAPPWHSSLRPVLLDKNQLTGSWYLVAEPLECGAWYKLGKPSPPYFQFVLGSDGWRQSQLTGEQVGRTPNMLISPRFTGEDPVVSAERLRNRNDFGPADARPIIRPASRC